MDMDQGDSIKYRKYMTVSVGLHVLHVYVTVSVQYVSIQCHVCAKIEFSGLWKCR